MKRKITSLVPIIFLCILPILLIGCTGTDRLAQDGAPLWTIRTPQDSKGLHYGVGSAKQSSVQLSRVRAESAAKDAIARWAETAVDNSLVNYIQDGGESLKSRQMLEVFESLSVQTVGIALRGVEVVDSYQASDGTVWVMSSYPIKNLKEAYRLKSEELERDHEEVRTKILLDYLASELARNE